MTNNPKVLVGEEIRNFCGSCKKFHSEPLVTGCARVVLFSCDAGHDRVSWLSPQAEECADYEKRTEATWKKISPKDYFKKLAFSIKDAEIRLVAAIMSDYVGEENAIRLDTLCWRVSMDERKVRLILGKLVTEYGVPVCAHSGKAGRWLARSFDEARETQAEYYSRAREDKRRGDAFNTCNYPPKPAEELRELQPTLIDVPEPDPIPFWRW